MSPTCLFIACDHGYGHTRRVCLLADRLAAYNWQVTVFANIRAVNIFKSMKPLHPAIMWHHFETDTRVKNFHNRNISDWVKALPDVSGYDLVVSDNLPEILMVRPDAVLCGSFLWHLSLSEIHPAVFALHRDLLTAHNPHMISQTLFVSDALESIVTLHKTGLCCIWPPEDRKIAKNSVLIACGKSGALYDDCRQFVGELSTRANLLPFEKVWVEPSLLPLSPPSWMFPADFSKDMYASICSAIIRPGVGSATDAIWAGARIYAVFESGNDEMKHNAYAIERNGLGEVCGSFQAALDAMMKCAADDQIRRSHKLALSKVSMNGVEESAELLQTIIAT